MLYSYVFKIKTITTCNARCAKQAGRLYPGFISLHHEHDLLYGLHHCSFDMKALGWIIVTSIYNNWDIF